MDNTTEDDALVETTIPNRIELAAVVATEANGERRVLRIFDDKHAAQWKEAFEKAGGDSAPTVELVPIEWRFGDSADPIEPLAVGLFKGSKLTSVHWESDPRTEFVDVMNKQMGSSKMPTDRKISARLIGRLTAMEFESLPKEAGKC